MTDFPEYLPVVWNSRTGLLMIKEPGTGRTFALVPSRRAPGSFEILPEHAKPADAPKKGEVRRMPQAKPNLVVIGGGKDE